MKELWTLLIWTLIFLILYQKSFQYFVNFDRVFFVFFIPIVITT